MLIISSGNCSPKPCQVTQCLMRHAREMGYVITVHSSIPLTEADALAIRGETFPAYSNITFFDCGLKQGPRGAVFKESYPYFFCSSCAAWIISNNLPPYFIREAVTFS